MCIKSQQEQQTEVTGQFVHLLVAFQLCVICNRASEWKLEEPQWVGRLRVTAKNKDLFIKLEDKLSGIF